MQTGHMRKCLLEYGRTGMKYKRNDFVEVAYL